jgi:NADPH2:quinone reductase
MRAWRFEVFGPYRDVLRLEPVTLPAPGAQECRVAMRAVALNFPDVLLIEGRYQLKPELPATPGMEGMGVVVEAGPGSRFTVGQRVVLGVLHGAFAEEVVVPDAFLLPAPEGMSDAQAAGFHVTYQTSHLALHHRGQLRAGETLLVHGGAGGVGTAAIQLGKAAGARVLAPASGPAKCEVARRCGAEAVIDLRSEDFVARVKALTDGRGVDVVYDPVGGEVFDRSLKIIAPEGRLLVIGFASGTIPSVPLNRLLLKNASVVGVQWGSYKFLEPERVVKAHEALSALFTHGALAPVLFEKAFAFEQLPDALAALMSREAYGKVIVTVGS